MGWSLFYSDNQINPEKSPIFPFLILIRTILVILDLQIQQSILFSIFVALEYTCNMYIIKSAGILICENEENNKKFPQHQKTVL